MSLEERNEKTPEKLILFLLVVTLVAPGVTASVIPGRWEKVEQLPEGSEIWVVLASGDRLQGRLSRMTPDGIMMSVLGAQDRELPRSSIRKILQIGERYNDSVWNGLAIGAVTGAGSYLAGHAILCCAPNAAHDAAGALVFAGIGMGIGALLDATSRSDERVVYRARK